MRYIFGAIGIVCVSVGVMFCTIFSAPKTKEEQRLEDEEQMEYLRKWYEEHKK